MNTVNIAISDLNTHLFEISPTVKTTQIVVSYRENNHELNKVSLLSGTLTIKPYLAGSCKQLPTNLASGNTLNIQTGNSFGLNGGYESFELELKDHNLKDDDLVVVTICQY